MNQNFLRAKDCIIHCNSIIQITKLIHLELIILTHKLKLIKSKTQFSHCKEIYLPRKKGGKLH